MSNKPLKPLRLTVSDFQCVKAAEVIFDGPQKTVKGRNGSGKSSLALSVDLMAGANLPNWKVIRDGADESISGFECTSPDGKITYIARMEITKKGGKESKRLVVKQKVGESVVPTDANMFRGLFGSAAYPSRYAELADDSEGLKKLEKMLKASMKPPAVDKELLDELGIVQLDTESIFDAVARTRKAVYDERTKVNVAVADLKARAAAIRIPVEYQRAKPVDVTALVAKTRELAAVKSGNDQRRIDLAAMRKLLATEESRIAELQKELDSAVEERDRSKSFIKLHGPEVDKLTDPDTTEIDRQLADAQTINTWAPKVAELDRVATAQEANESDAAEKTTLLDQIDHFNADLMAKSTLPVPGLSFSDETGVMIDGRPMASRSRSQKYRDCCLIAMSQSRIGILFVDESAEMDDDLKADILEDAQERGFVVVWLVHDAKASELVIE